MKILTLFLRLGRAFLFYPAMVGLFLWLYVKGAHWIFGLAVILAILILDPIWRIMAGKAVRAVKNHKKRAD